MNSKFKILSLLGCMLCLNAVLTACNSDSDKDVSPRTATISLIGFNDFHGKLENGGTAQVFDPAAPGGARVSLGGAAYLASMVEQLKRENPAGSIVVANGDLIGASPLISRVFHEEPTIEVLNQIGLEVSSVGNHEFDNGKDELLRLAGGGCAKSGVIGKDTCLREGQFKGADFQYLAANVIEDATGKTLLPAYTIKNVNNVKVGFIGLTLRDTPSVVAAGGTDGLTFKDEIQTINDLVPELEGKGAEVIIVLLHQGGITSSNIINEQSCTALTEDIISLVDRLNSRIDVVYNAHTHWGYNCKRPDGKLIISSASYGMLVSKTDIEFDLHSRKVVNKNGFNHIVANGFAVKDGSGALIAVPSIYTVMSKNEAVERIVDFYKNLIKPISEEVVGKIEKPIDRAQNNAGESALANLNADIYLWETSSRNPAYANKPADFAVEDWGGVRADLENSHVTFGDITNVMPFGNKLVTKNFTGRQIIRLLEQQWEAPQPVGNTRVLAVSSNVNYT